MLWTLQDFLKVALEACAGNCPAGPGTIPGAPGWPLHLLEVDNNIILDPKHWDVPEYFNSFSWRAGMEWPKKGWYFYKLRFWREAQRESNRQKVRLRCSFCVWVLFLNMRERFCAQLHHCGHLGHFGEPEATLKKVLSGLWNQQYHQKSAWNAKGVVFVFWCSQHERKVLCDLFKYIFALWANISLRHMDVRV